MDHFNLLWHTFIDVDHQALRPYGRRAFRETAPEATSFEGFLRVCGDFKPQRSSGTRANRWGKPPEGWLRSQLMTKMGL